MCILYRLYDIMMSHCAMLVVIWKLHQITRRIECVNAKCDTKRENALLVYMGFTSQSQQHANRQFSHNAKWISRAYLEQWMLARVKNHLIPLAPIYPPTLLIAIPNGSVCIYCCKRFWMQNSWRKSAFAIQLTHSTSACRFLSVVCIEIYCTHFCVDNDADELNSLTLASP